MKLKVLIFLLVLTSLAIAYFSRPTQLTPIGNKSKGLEKGINVAFFRKIEDSDTITVEETLDYLKNIGVTHISIVLFVYQDSKNSTKIYADPYRTLPEDQLINYLRMAKKKGFSLQLRPLLGVVNEKEGSVGRWNITPTNVNMWFGDYEQKILKYAELSSREGIEVFGIGSEMSSLSSNRDEWINLINKVREVYKGEILYAANWDDFTKGSFKEGIDWLTGVDIIGVDAYYPLETKENPSVEELLKAWEKWKYIFEWLKKSNKKIIVSEIGITSTQEHFDEPWRFNFDGVFEIDLKAQEKYYEATFRFFQNRVGGIYWWVVDEGLMPKVPEKDRGFSPLGKPAEEVLRRWYEADYN